MLDEQTKKVQMSLPVYNGEYVICTLVSINFYFSRGEHIWKRIIAMSTWHGMHNVAVDGIWCLFLLYIVFNEFRKIISAYRGQEFVPHRPMPPHPARARLLHRPAADLALAETADAVGPRRGARRPVRGRGLRFRLQLFGADS